MGRYFLGRPGWPDDLHHALAMARNADPLSYVTVVTYVYRVDSPKMRAQSSSLPHLRMRA
jgi:hypothetical protein